MTEPDSYIGRVVATCKARPDDVAMRIVGDDSEFYTFRTMLDMIRAVAHRLSQEGISAGDRVALIGENHPYWAFAYLGILYHGAICVPMDPHGEIETVSNFVENSEAKLAFLSPDLTERFAEIRQRIGRDVPAVVWRLETASSAEGFRDFDEWISGGYPDEMSHSVPAFETDDNALLMYTSGTTGKPKGVPLTHGNILAEITGIDGVMKFSQQERILSLLPLFHTYLQIVNLWVAFTVGAEVGYLKELTPAELASAMKSFKPTILTTVPRLWYLFHKKIFDAVEAKPAVVRALFRTMLRINGFTRDTFRLNLGGRFFGQVHESFGGNLRIAVSGGSRFDEDVAIDFHRLGFTILQGYGLTETSGAATATFEADNRVGSVGKPMLGNEIKLDQPDKDGVGEVLIRGGVVFKGYYQNDEATRNSFTDNGWFRSGDLGKLDKDGHLYIVGRAKDVIVLPSGKNVHPEDLETHYLKSPAVEELAIVGVRDETAQHAGSEKLVAVVVPDFTYLKQQNIANSKEAVRYSLDSLGRELPDYQRVRDYIVRTEPLPRTATRKVKRFELTKAIEDGTIGGTGPAVKEWKLSAEDEQLLATKMGSLVIGAIRQNSKDAETIHPDMNLEIDLGLDSLGRAEMFASIEHALGLQIEAEDAADLLTVRDTITFLRGHVDDSQLQDHISADLDWGRIVRDEGEAIPELKPILDDRPVFETFAFSVFKLFNVAAGVLFGLEVRGIENFTRMKAPFLVCPNHQSFLDPFVLCSTYPYDFFRRSFHVGASQFFSTPFMRWVGQMLQVVPVDPDTQLMRAMRAGAIGLQHGKILNIYPEGERAYDGELHNFKRGAAILATELDLPIVPVAIDGMYKVWARDSNKIRLAKVKISFGTAFRPSDVIASMPLRPVDASADAPSGDRDREYDLVTEHLRNTIAAMIEEMRR